MNLNRAAFIIILFLFASFQKIQANVIITGKITGDIHQEVVYTVPINGVFYEGFFEKVKTDEAGNFKIELNVEKASIVSIYISSKVSRQIIIEPGQNYQVSIYISKVNQFSRSMSNTFNITCNSTKGQNLFNALATRPLVSFEARKYVRDTAISKIRKIIEFQ